MMDSQTGEIIERRLDHEAGEARKFYAALPAPARIGMEAPGRTQWFERMLAEEGNFAGLARLNRELIGKAEAIESPYRAVLDMNSTEIPAYGEQEQSAYNGHFESTCSSSRAAPAARRAMS